MAQAAASPPAAPGAASGADVASLAAQFRSRHEELARSLQRLEGAVGTRPGAQDTHRLLVDSVEVRAGCGVHVACHGPVCCAQC